MTVSTPLTDSERSHLESSYQSMQQSSWPNDVLHPFWEELYTHVLSHPHRLFGPETPYTAMGWFLENIRYMPRDFSEREHHKIGELLAQEWKAHVQAKADTWTSWKRLTPKRQATMKSVYFSWFDHRQFFVRVPFYQGSRDVGPSLDLSRIAFYDLLDRDTSWHQQALHHLRISQEEYTFLQYQSMMSAHQSENMTSHWFSATRSAISSLSTFSPSASLTKPVSSGVLMKTWFEQSLQSMLPSLLHNSFFKDHMQAIAEDKKSQKHPFQPFGVADPSWVIHDQWMSLCEQEALQTHLDQHLSPPEASPPSTLPGKRL